jgi:hypothetical protein
MLNDKKSTVNGIIPENKNQKSCSGLKQRKDEGREPLTGGRQLFVASLIWAERYNAE